MFIADMFYRIHDTEKYPLKDGMVETLDKMLTDNGIQHFFALPTNQLLFPARPASACARLEGSCPGSVRRNCQRPRRNTSHDPRPENRLFYVRIRNPHGKETAPIRQAPRGQPEGMAFLDVRLLYGRERRKIWMGSRPRLDWGRMGKPMGHRTCRSRIPV